MTYIDAIRDLPRVAIGNVLDVLATLPEQSVHCCVTSPPYFGLRDYKTAPQIWDGDPKCKHAWGSEIPGDPRGGSGTPTNKNNRGEGYGRDSVRGAFCTRCSSWRGSLGNEPTPNLYITHLVQIFRALRRVLRDDGVLFLNLGDSFFGDSPQRTSSAESFSPTWDASQTRSRGGMRRSAARVDGLKPKDLIGIPWSVALALRADGWWLRSDIIWHKKNPMPESVTDRCTMAHEYIFLLTKSARYFFDMEAVKEVSEMRPQNRHTDGRGVKDVGYADHRKAPGMTAPNGRNIRSVWTITADPYRDAHFATFPREIPRRAILAGTSEKGCCPKCGAPWERVVEKSNARLTDRQNNNQFKHDVMTTHGEGATTLRVTTDTATTGWRPTCDCPKHEPIPCTVMDIFAGSGTTLRVAEDLGRLWFGIDLSDQYLPLIKKRTAQRTILGLVGRMAVKKNMSRK